MADLVVYKKVATQLVPHACGQQTFPSDPLQARRPPQTALETTGLAVCTNTQK